MTKPGTTCELVAEGDLDTQYLSGKLSQEEAEAFEAHFFECERCWGLLQQGLEVRAAHEGLTGPSIPSSPPNSPSSVSAKGPRRLLHPHAGWGLAAAAALVVAVIGVRQLRPNGEAGTADETLRGGVATLTVRPGTTKDSVTATWPRLAQAELYRVRLYTADGTLLAEREVSDTSFILPVDSLGRLPARAEAFWEVQALDRLRQPIARSDLTKATLPHRSP